MKLKRKIMVTLILLFFLVIGAVSASENLTDNTASIDVTNGDTITPHNDNSCGEKTSTVDNTILKVKKSDTSKDIEIISSQEDYLLKNNKPTINETENTIKTTKQDKTTITNDNGEYIDITNAFTYLNNFRTEEGVWHWNEGDTTKTVFNTNTSNQLKPLRWSSALEQTAKIRAKELKELFDHIRPDGTKYFTAYPDNLWGMGENIAYGYSTCYLVTEAFKETDEPYNGQDHRRNMLNPNFNCIGIAGYKVNNIIYWVQSFGYKNGIENEEPESPTITKPSEDNDNTNTNKDSDNNITSNTTTNKSNISLTQSPNTRNIYSTVSTGKTQKIIKIIAPKKTFKRKLKTKKYTITVKKIVKGLKFTLKIGKKIYKATSNNKGKVTFKITKLNKKGQYTAIITYKGSKNYKKINKKVKIIIK